MIIINVLESRLPSNPSFVDFLQGKGDSVFQIYPWFKFHLPLFLGKLMHWNKLHVKREGLHHILGSLKKDVFE